MLWYILMIDYNDWLQSISTLVIWDHTNTSFTVWISIHIYHPVFWYLLPMYLSLRGKQCNTSFSCWGQFFTSCQDVLASHLLLFPLWFCCVLFSMSFPIQQQSCDCSFRLALSCSHVGLPQSWSLYIPSPLQHLSLSTSHDFSMCWLLMTACSLSIPFFSYLGSRFILDTGQWQS